MYDPVLGSYGQYNIVHCPWAGAYMAYCFLWDATPRPEDCPIAAWAHEEALPPTMSPDHPFLGTRAGHILVVVQGVWDGFALSDSNQDGGQLLGWSQAPPPRPGALALSFTDPSMGSEEWPWV